MITRTDYCSISHRLPDEFITACCTVRQNILLGIARVLVRGPFVGQEVFPFGMAFLLACARARVIQRVTMMLDIAAIFEVEAKGPSCGAPSDWALDLRLLAALELATFTCLRFWTSEE